jgi:Amt family ammonium transporter
MCHASAPNRIRLGAGERCWVEFPDLKGRTGAFRPAGSVSMTINGRRVVTVLGAVMLVMGLGGSVTSWSQGIAPPAASADVLAESAAAAVPAAPTSAVDSGDTAWMLASAGLVLLMTPGLAFFYGGLVRKKNVLSILMQCFMAMCLVTIQWVLFGYSLAFGPTVRGLIGSLDWALLKGVGGEPFAGYAATIPHSVFMAFQLKFAIITPALIIGAFAERMKFSTFCVFVILWTTLVYDPVAHWVWGMGGMLARFDAQGNAIPGALDFAGGAVVHINAGAAALAAALVLGRRLRPSSPPHNLPLAILGAGMLWFGWFGFNAGSALGANATAANAFVTTHVATAAAGLTWSVCDWLHHKRATTLGMITGAVAGLVAITPACGFVSPVSAIWIGVGSSVLGFLSVTFLKAKLGYDDALDAFGVHGVGGFWGALATGLFAQESFGGFNGLFHGNAAQFMIQLKASAITAVYSFVVSIVLFKILDLLMGLRVGEHEERVGLDLTQHKEAAYTVLD